MIKDSITIVFATDANYSLYTSIAISSILENGNPSTYYQFVILISSDFSEECRHLTIKTVSSFENSEVNFVEAGTIFDNSHIGISHITTPTYYRLLLPSILQNIDECLYLDSDIVVCGDLSELFNIDISNYYVAGVKAPWYILQRETIGSKESKDLIPTDRYINAGVLLMNLDKIRRDGIDKKFIEFSTQEFVSQDQDIVNVSCYDAILHLPLRYNTMTKFYDTDRVELEKVFSADEIEAAFQNPLIIHYADRVKPWQDMTIPFADRWWGALKKCKAFCDYCEQLMRNQILQNKKLIRRYRIANEENIRIKQSITFRVGKVVLWLPRTVKNTFMRLIR